MKAVKIALSILYLFILQDIFAHSLPLLSGIILEKGDRMKYSWGSHTGIINGVSMDISGKVTHAETRESLPGVSVYIKNTLIGTTTDIHGNYTLKGLRGDSATLVYSFVGFQTREMVIAGIPNQPIDIALEPAAFDLDEVVIASARNEQKAFEQTTNVSVIPRKKIIGQAAQNIPEAISREPSVSFSGTGYHKAPSIRGLAKKRIVMMVDGERISSERNQGAPGTFVDPLNVNSIEILRGPYSTLYGSDAVGGVVNILSVDYQKPLSNNYVGGAFDANYQSISQGYNMHLAINTQIDDRLFFHLTAGKRVAQAYRDAGGKEVQGTNYSEQAVTGKITWKIHNNHELQINGYLSYADSIGLPAYTDSLNALHPNDNHYKAGIRYQWKQMATWFPEMSVRASFHRHRITARIYNYTSIRYGRVLNQRKNLYNNDWAYQHDFSLIIIPKIKVLTGIDFYRRGAIHIDENLRAYQYDPSNPNFFLGERVYEGPQDTIMDNSYENSLGVFAQAAYRINSQLSINGGIRWNTFKTEAHLVHTTQIGPPYDYARNTYETQIKHHAAFSGNMGSSYKPIPWMTLTANVGQAFRVPSVKELFVNTMTPDGMNFCNPDLVPERSFNVDFGIRFRDGHDNTVTLSLYRNRVHDMIVLEWDSLHASGQFNNNDALLYGGEIAFDFTFWQKLFINGNLSYNYGREDHGEYLEDIPPFQFNLETRVEIIRRKLFAAIAGKYNARQTNVAIGDIPTGAFVVLDFLSGWTINKYVNIYFSVNNLLNASYREHYQYYWEHMPGRSFNAAVQVQF